MPWLQEHFVIDLTQVVQFIVLASGFVAASLTRRKTEAEVANTLSNTMLNVEKIRQEAMKKMLTQAKRHERYDAYLMKGIMTLQLQVKKQGGKPKFQPRTFTDFE